MGKKQNLKQHMIMVSLFIVANYIFTISFFSKGIKRDIANLKTNIKNAQEEKKFLRGQAPKERIEIESLKIQLNELKERNRKYTALEHSSGTTPLHLKVNAITQNAHRLNIDIESSSTKKEDNSTIYQLKFSSPFQSIVELINSSYDELDKISISKIHLENVEGELQTTLEFSL